MAEICFQWPSILKRAYRPHVKYLKIILPTTKKIQRKKNYVQTCSKVYNKNKYLCTAYNARMYVHYREAPKLLPPPRYEYFIKSFEVVNIVSKLKLGRSSVSLSPSSSYSMVCNKCMYNIYYMHNTL